MKAVLWKEEINNVHSCEHFTVARQRRHHSRHHRFRTVLLLSGSGARAGRAEWWDVDTPTTKRISEMKCATEALIL